MYQDTLNLTKMLRHFKPSLDVNDEVGGGAPAHWIATLPPDAQKLFPEDVAKDPNFTKYKTTEEFVKGHRSLVETVGKKGVIIPGEKATPEEMSAFYETLGRPKKPEDYKFTPNDKLHPSVKSDPEREKWFRGVAHELGLSAKAADALNAKYGEMVSAQITAQETAKAEGMAKATEALKKEWGDNYDANLTAAATLVERIGGDGAREAFGDLGSNPEVLKLLHKISGAISEDSFSKILNPGQGGGETDAQKVALGKIEEIKANKAHALHNENDPKHDEAVEEWKKLHAEAYPS